jgi:hypothetical protein
MVDLNALLTPSMSNLTSLLPTSTVQTVLRLISYRSWRWSFSWGFRRCSASAFRSCCTSFACKNFLHHPQNICFFIGDVATHLRIGLSNINKTRIKRKQGLANLRDAKKSREKLKIFTNTTRLNLDYLFPGNSARKRGLLTVNTCIKVRLDLQADKSSFVVKGHFFPQVLTQGIKSVEQCVKIQSNKRKTL